MSGLHKLIHKVASELDAEVRNEHGDGIATAVAGGTARVRKTGQFTATPGFAIPPGLTIEPGDAVDWFHRGQKRVIERNRSRDAFQSTASGASWPWVDVRDHGAVGDGQADDTAAIQAADAAATAASQALFFPGGTYIAEGLAPTTDWIGSVGSVIKLRDGSALDLLTVADDVSGITISDLEFDGNAAKVASENYGLIIGGTRNTVTRCYVHDVLWDGITIATGASLIAITDCVVEDIGRSGITGVGSALDPITHCLISRNRVSRVGISAGAGSGLGITGIGSYISFIGNVTVDTTFDGLAAYNRHNSHLVVTGNIFRNAGNNGLHVGGSHILVNDNLVDAPAHYGIFVASDPNGTPTPAVNAVVTGNVVVSPGTQAGIEVQAVTGFAIGSNRVVGAHTHGIEVVSCASGTITGNSSTGAVAGSGIRIDRSRDVTIGDNVSKGNAARGIYLTDDGVTITEYVNIADNIVASNGTWGIQSEGSSRQLSVHDNRLYSNTSGNFSIANNTGNRIGRNYTDDSTNVASAATVTLPFGESLYTITGTTTITSISAARNNQRTVVLKFAGILTVTDGSNLKLVGNFVTAVDSMLTLVCDGTNWYEIARSSP